MSTEEKQSALLIAYHYPPVRVSSGLQRTLSFSQNLQEYGWQPAVLPINSAAYEATSEDQLKDTPSDVDVMRAWGLDTARHLTLKGRYLSLMAPPDRWITWWFGAVWQGLKYIEKHKPKVIFSTYPIATAHLVV